MNELNFKGKISNSNNILIHIVLTVFSLICVLPFILIFSISLSAEKDILANGYSIIPRNFTLLAYKVILKDPRQLIDSYLVTISVTIIGTLLGLWLITSLAFVMTRKDYKYRNKLSFYIFFTMLFSGGLVPFYILVSIWLGMKNTLFALFLPYLVNAWYVLLMKGFLQSLPYSLVESAKLDGASEIIIFIRIIIPVAKPALATVGLFMVLQYWNDWWLGMLFIDNSNLFPLQYLLIRVMKNLEFLNTEFARQFLNLGQMDIPTMSARMAMCILVAGPTIFVFPFFQKYFVKGITVGSIKG